MMGPAGSRARGRIRPTWSVKSIRGAKTVKTASMTGGLRGDGRRSEPRRLYRRVGGQPGGTMAERASIPDKDLHIGHQGTISHETLIDHAAHGLGRRPPGLHWPDARASN